MKCNAIVGVLSSGFCLMVLTLGCACCERQCPTCPPTTQPVSEQVVCEVTYQTSSQPLNCPPCKDQVMIYTRDGGVDLGCPKCEITKREKPIIECRPPKVTPKPSPCFPCPPCPVCP